MSNLLVTKLHVPQLRTTRVLRPRLVSCLEEGLTKKLTLISAPAGYGKTTLLCEWLAACLLPAAWLSLDKADHDPARFWAYTTAALQNVFTSLGDSLPEGLLHESPLTSQSMMTDLLNELDRLHQPVILILDDYHNVQNQVIDDELAFLIEHAPARFHIVIATRVDPPLPLARLRARSQMLELRQTDLCFTTQEAADFLNDIMGLQLSADKVSRLLARTEGWIAGLQMAAMSMQGRLKQQGPEGVSHFIESFSGSNRFILDYLMEEVIGQQPAEMREFLYRSSILEQLTASLCDALTDRPNSQSMLDQAEQANLFLIPLDDDRQWYRYHHLFAEHLRRRLKQTQPDIIAGLHQRASDWYARNQMLPQAIGHALDAGDVLRVNELVSGNALAMLENTGLLDVVGHFKEIPEDFFVSKPWLCVAHAWVLLYIGELQHAAERLQDAEKAIAVQGESAVPDNRILGHMDAIRAEIIMLEGRLAPAEEFVRRALEILPETDRTARSFALRTLGNWLRFSSRLPEAEQALADAVEVGRASGDSHITALALCDLALMRCILGRMHQAYATYQEALHVAGLYEQVSGRELPAIGYVYVHLSRLLYEWNELEQSLRFARQGVKMCQQWGPGELLVDGYFTLADALATLKDWDGALDTIAQARHTARNLSDWYFARWVEPVEVSIRLKQGDVDFAARWLERAEGTTGRTDQSMIPDTTRVRLYFQMAQGRLDEALVTAKARYDVAEASRAASNCLTFLAYQAAILHLQHKEDQALESLDQALRLAEPEGYVRTFVDLGQPMYELLRDSRHPGVSPAYLEKLVAAFGMEAGTMAPARPQPAAQAGQETENMEPLSEREVQVLRLLDGPLTTKEIGRELYVSVNTIRTHIRNIYGKLGVKRRAAAVSRAKELKLM